MKYITDTFYKQIIELTINIIIFFACEKYNLIYNTYYNKSNYFSNSFYKHAFQFNALNLINLRQFFKSMQK
jgi:hypothetical protein